jgi:hypothetical protein
MSLDKNDLSKFKKNIESNKKLLNILDDIEHFNGKNGHNGKRKKPRKLTI